MNTRLLRELAEHIVEKPKLFDMGSWFSRDISLMSDAIAATYEKQVGNKTREQCGTTACMAGEACLLADRAQFKKGIMVPTDATKHQKSGIYGDSRIYVDWEGEGQEVLGLTNVQASNLFYVENWPEKYRAGYYREKATKQEKACVAAARIKHFIKTGGRE